MEFARDVDESVFGKGVAESVYGPKIEPAQFRSAEPEIKTQAGETAPRSRRKKRGLAQFLPVFGTFGEELGVAGQRLGDVL